MRLATFLVSSILPYFGACLTCYNCQTGYVTSEFCSNQLPSGYVLECDDPGAQCYQSIQWFADGALRLAMRGCWTPPNNSTVGGFCENYDNTQGVLKYCNNCTGNLCNTEALYFPVKLLDCYV